MLRVLHLVTCLQGGGAQRIVHDLATSGAWEVRVVALREPAEGADRFSSPLRQAGVPVVCLGMRHPLDLGRFLRLFREVRRFRPHVLHAHLFHAHMAARAVRGAKVVCTHHEVERRPRPLRPLLQRLTAGLDAATVAVSAAVARHALDDLGARSDRLRVIYPGVDPARFRPGGDRAAARRALGLPPEAEVVGALGRLHPQKGLPDLVEAFARLDRPQAVLALVGEGAQEEELRAQARRLGVGDRVHFPGHVEDSAQALPAFDVFAMPSRWEGFGLALAEALACGIPAVCTTVDSLPEVAGRAALLVPPGQPEALAHALERLLLHPPPPSGGDGRFSVQRMVQSHREMYLQLV